jgi:hypothetical protein
VSPTQKQRLKDDAEELQEDVDRLEADLQEAEPRVSRDVVVSIEITCRTDDPDVTDDQIAAAAQQQVTLPNTIWIDKPGGGQIPVTVVTVVQEPDEVLP